MSVFELKEMHNQATPVGENVISTEDRDRMQLERLGKKPLLKVQGHMRNYNKSHELSTTAKLRHPFNSRVRLHNSRNMGRPSRDSLRGTSYI